MGLETSPNKPKLKIPQMLATISSSKFSIVTVDVFDFTFAAVSATNNAMQYRITYYVTLGWQAGKWEIMQALEVGVAAKSLLYHKLISMPPPPLTQRNIFPTVNHLKFCENQTGKRTVKLFQVLLQHFLESAEHMLLAGSALPYTETHYFSITSKD
uniref:Uncharacterized protein n=1 Tax=Glossina austeni TaxID=7395 RepID=A0A1A9UX74_GLOAU